AGVRPLLVTEEAISNARRLLWEQLRILAEPGGATALAAIVGGAYVPQSGETVVIVVSGGNSSSLPTDEPTPPATD
ncbi:MAG: hypothetical protein ACRD0B_11485, partial [Acidimicrobiales bacterium]